MSLLICARSLISVGITTLSDTSLVEQVGTNGTRHPICEGACMLLMVTSNSLIWGGKAVLIYMSPEQWPQRAKEAEPSTMEACRLPWAERDRILIHGSPW